MRQKHCNNKFLKKNLLSNNEEKLSLKVMNLRISTIYYFLLTLGYISFSAHEKDIISILKSKKYAIILRLNRKG